MDLVPVNPQCLIFYSYVCYIQKMGCVGVMAFRDSVNECSSNVTMVSVITFAVD